MKFLILFLVPYVLYALSLHEAIERMDHEAFLSALDSGENVNGLKNGQTPLALAVKKQNSTMVSKLLDASADVNLGKPTPIMEAFLADNSEIAAQLIEHDAKLPQSLDISGEGLIYDLLLQRRYKSVAFLLNRGVAFRKDGALSPFTVALSFAPLFLIETFVNHNVDINYKDPHLDRPMDIALRLKRHDVVALLIRQGADVADSHFLEIAVSQQDLKALKMLVQAGTTLDAKRQNLLILAVKYGNVEILQELARAGASLNYVTKSGETALTEAIKYKQDDIAFWLISNEIDPDIHKDAIFYAIDHGDIDMIKRLIQKEIGIKAKNRQGLTPLLYANKVKQFTVAQYLLTQNVDIEAEDKMGETALFKSIRYFQNDMMDLLLAKEAQTDHKNRKGLSALGLSVATGNFEAFQKLLALSSAVDKEAVILSVKKGLERFYVLLHERFNVKSVVDEKANTLLHLAAANDRMNLLKRLLLQGLDLEAINHRGETALHVAAKEGYKRSCSLLLGFDADIKAVDMRENTPQNLALKNNHVKLSKWLENYQIKQEECEVKDINATAVSTI